MNELLDQITEDQILEKMYRPNSKWKLVKVYEYIILITPIPNSVIGAVNVNLPDYLKASQSIVCFEGVSYNLCFWYCLTLHYEPTSRLDRMATMSKKMFKKFYGEKSKVTNYQGIKMNEIEQVESFFKISINIYNITKD
jgi:hypothetical protein